MGPFLLRSKTSEETGSEYELERWGLPLRTWPRMLHRTGVRTGWLGLAASGGNTLFKTFGMGLERWLLFHRT